MKKKFFSFCICMLMITTIVPLVGSVENNTIQLTPKNSYSTNLFNGFEDQKLLASDGAAGDRFGISVSVSDNTILIGSSFDDHDEIDSGSAYVFTCSSNIWTEQTKLIPSDCDVDDEVGWSVSLDGDTALVGAYKDDDNGADSGSAYVFVRSGSSWTQQAKLLASDGAAGDLFGFEVSLSGDTALIGAHKDDDNGADSGSAYVFVRSGSSWTQQAKLLASDGASGDKFGIPVSLSGDTALIGAYAANSFRGSAYVFTRSGTSWIQQAKLVASDANPGDAFSVNVALDGDTALIGACYDDSDKGSAYIFTRTGTTWTQQQKIQASDSSYGDCFGFSVSLDGNIALIGSWANYAYIFTCIGPTWIQKGKLIASDSASGDYFGYEVSYTDNTAVIGAYLDDDNGVDSGSVYVFTNEPPNPPIITGPIIGKINFTMQYNFAATDPDDDDIFYFIDWGDGTISGWIGPYSSGTQITREHSWSKSGRFPIMVKAKDIYDAESNWSENYSVDIYDLQLMISGGLGIKVSILNNGTIDVKNVDWSITIKGGILGLINRTVDGIISEIPAGESTSVKSGLFLGFGDLEITASTYDVIKEAKGTQFIIFSKVK